mmetsp:Transcript_148647/g.262737  ORF Transcript_148647/g.262737 Transcript_148647/m.262737 type:complete len:417 (-) Transcript_148647:66-1316(-)
MTWGEAYSFAHSASVGQQILVGGGDPSVGITGWALGGGHGPLVRAFGTGAHNLVRVELVDASGELRNVSAHASELPELFQACKGGGGGTFGIVTKLTFRLHPEQRTHLFQLAINTSLSVWTSMKARAAALDQTGFWLADTLSQGMLENDPLQNIVEDDVSKALISGGTLELSHQRAGELVFKLFVRAATDADADQKVAPLVALAAVHPHAFTVLPTERYASFAEYASSAASKPPGTPEYSVSSLLGPAAFQSADGRSSAVTASVEGMERLDAEAMAAGSSTRHQCTMAFLGGKTGMGLAATALHPTWERAVSVQACSAYGWSGAPDGAGLSAAAASMNQWSAVTLTPLGMRGGLLPAGYVNEAQTSNLTVNWRDFFWSKEKYSTLLKAKRRYDPAGVFSCAHCVGDSESAAFTTVV